MIKKEKRSGKTRLSAKDGKFCINGIPTKLVGWNFSLWALDNDIDKPLAQMKVLSQYGFNAIRLCNEYPVLYSFLKEGGLEKATSQEPPLKGILEIVKKCDELGMVIQMTPHVVFLGCNNWVVPEMGECPPEFRLPWLKNQCLNEIYFNKEVRQKFLDIYDVFAKTVADYNNIMWAPPNEQNPALLFDEARGFREYLEHTEEHWINWLKKRYGKVSDLKKAWVRSTPDIEKLQDDWKEIAKQYIIDFQNQKFSPFHPIDPELQKLQRDAVRFRPDVLDFLSETYYDWIKDIARTVRKYNPDWLVIDGGDHPVYPSFKALVNYKRKLLREGIIQGMTQHCINSWLLFYGNPGIGIGREGWGACPPDCSLPIANTDSRTLKASIKAIPFVHMSEWAIFKVNGGVVFADEGIDPYWESMVPPLLINSCYLDGDLNWAWHLKGRGEVESGMISGGSDRETIKKNFERWYINSMLGYPSIIRKERLYWWLAFTELCQYQDWHKPNPDVLIILNPQKPNYHSFIIPLVQILNRSNISYSTTQIDEFTKEELSNFKLIIYIAENQNLNKVVDVFKETAKNGKVYFLVLGDGSYDDSGATHDCFGPWQGKLFFKSSPSLNRIAEESPIQVKVTSDFFSLKKGDTLNLQKLGYEWIAFDVDRLKNEVLGSPESILECAEQGKKYSSLVVSGNVACLGSVPISTSLQDVWFQDYEKIMRAILSWAGINLKEIKDYIQIPKANGLGVFVRPEPEGESVVNFPAGIDLVKSLMEFKKATYSSPVTLKGYDYKILLPYNVDVVGYPYVQKKGVFGISQTTSFLSFEVTPKEIKFKTTGPDTTTAEIALYDIPFSVSSVKVDGKSLLKEKEWKVREDSSLLLSFCQTEKEHLLKILP